MRVSSINAIVAFFVALVTSQRLNKPPLQPDLDNLKQGLLDNLHPVHSTRDRFKAGYIPSDCKTIAQREGFNAADIQVWNIHYDDNGGAYNDRGNIAFFGDTMSNLNVHIHEAAHSLDLQNAYKDKPLSSSTNWLNNYNKDPNVPDNYAQTNQIENVAQNTVITTYERNVPGGFWGLNPDANKIFYQYATVDTEQREAGKLLVPGGKCTSRLANSDPVPISGVATAATAAEKPDVALSADVSTIPDVDFNTKDSCQAAFAA
ncbi:MAG: hypothetical protein Q9225_007831 [Loekoesia sp. 1 TL-2023]